MQKQDTEITGHYLTGWNHVWKILLNWKVESLGWIHHYLSHHVSWWNRFLPFYHTFLFRKDNKHRQTRFDLNPGNLPRKPPKPQGFPDHRIARHHFPHLDSEPGISKSQDLFVLRKKQWKPTWYFAWHQIYSYYYFGWWAKLVDIAYIYTSIYIYIYIHIIQLCFRMIGSIFTLYTGWLEGIAKDKGGKHLRKMSTCMYNIHSMYSYKGIYLHIHILWRPLSPASLKIQRDYVGSRTSTIGLIYPTYQAKVSKQNCKFTIIRTVVHNLKHLLHLVHSYIFPTIVPYLQSQI